MSINSNPIVLKDTNGNLKEASQTDLEYMAFQAGLRISSDVDSTQPYAINTDATTDDTLIGSFVDTFYNEPVGTHDGSSLTTGSTTTFLYQRESNEISTDELSTFRRPVADSDSGTSIVDMGDASMTTLSRELMKILQGDEMPGAFRLSSSAPSADWSASLPNVFSDTTTDGNVTSYSIYQRTSGTMPDSCSPMYVRRDDYGSRPLADYNGGLQAMTQEQVSVTFGQIVRKFFADGEVGTYQLRSSAQGAPTLDILPRVNNTVGSIVVSHQYNTLVIDPTLENIPLPLYSLLEPDNSLVSEIMQVNMFLPLSSSLVIELSRAIETTRETIPVHLPSLLV
jgi:hypothetical protein